MTKFVVGEIVLARFWSPTADLRQAVILTIEANGYHISTTAHTYVSPNGEVRWKRQAIAFDYELIKATMLDILLLD